MHSTSGIEQSSFDAMLQLDHPIKMAARDWANDNLPAADDTPQIVNRETWTSAGSYGLLGLQLPKSHGGSAASAAEIALSFEGLGLSHADKGVVYAIASQAITTNRAIAISGNPAQLDRWAGPLANGELFAAFAMSEVDAGSDPWGLTTTAKAQDDGSFVLNGTKSWITLAPICDVAVVFAVTDPSRGSWGISAFIVPAETDGFERGPVVEKMGLSSSPFGELRLTDCHVGPEALLGRVGSGASIFTRMIDAERALLYASLIGSVERSITASIDHARTRRQGQSHIGEHQAVAHRIVDMKLHHEAARLLLYKTTARYDRNESITLDAALTKLLAAEHGVQSSIDAMRTFGASGYTTALGLESDIRDALGGLAYSGTLDIARNIVAAQLGLSRPST